MADYGALINSIPPVTRFMLIATAAVTGPCLLGIFQAKQVAYLWPYVYKRYEIWRPFTAFFYGGSGFPLLFDFFLIYRNSSSLETNAYFGNTAEYAWAHVMLGCSIHIFNLFLGMPFLFRPLLHAQNYLWCRANPTMKVSIFGLITIPTSLYPPAMILLDLITGGLGKALGGVMGLLAGHLWWFLSTYLPVHAPARIKRPNPLPAPVRFRALFSPPSRSSGGAWRTGAQNAGPTFGSSGTGTARGPARPDPVEAVRHRWGGGQRLGGEPL